MPRIPSRIVDGSLFGAAWNLSREALRGHEPLGAPGLLTSHTVHGVLREAEGAAVPAYAPEAGNLVLVRLKSVQGDYLTCRTWDGTSEGDADIYVAKPHKVRESITQETIEGTLYSYTYIDGVDAFNRIRIAAASGVEVERCSVTPEWLENDLIWALPAVTLVYRTLPDADPVDLLALHNRLWARRIS